MREVVPYWFIFIVDAPIAKCNSCTSVDITELGWWWEYFPSIDWKGKVVKPRPPNKQNINANPHSILKQKIKSKYFIWYSDQKSQFGNNQNGNVSDYEEKELLANRHGHKRGNGSSPKNFSTIRKSAGFTIRSHMGLRKVKNYPWILKYSKLKTIALR